MKQVFTRLLLMILVLMPGVLKAQVLLSADGAGSTYELCQSKGYNVESPDCGHNVRHISETFDSQLGKNVFVFTLHRDLDDDRCMNTDRQRIELRGSGSTQQGTKGSTTVYRWKFKLDAGFQESPNFSHIFQVKAYGNGHGSGAPILTLSLRHDNTFEIIHPGSATDVVKTASMTPFRGTWVEAFVKIKHDDAGSATVTIKRLSDGLTLITWTDTSIDMWEDGAGYGAPKFGFYRSLNSTSYLRDESIRFADICVTKGAESGCPSAVGSNSAPSVSISSPSSGATFNAPATITINANASDTDGTISKVDFYNGSTFLGTDTSSPYSFTWSGVGAGSYSLNARATDNGNATSTSSSVSVTVQALPTCPAAIASADDGNVAANVLDNNFATRWSASGDGQWIQFCLGTEQYVRGVDIAFYSGNVRQSIFDVLLSSDGSSWTTVATGLRSSGTSLALETFTFAPRLAKYVRIVGHGNTVNLWNSYTEVRVLIGQPNSAPTVSIASPANNATFTAPASITINANAADSDGTISKVEFFQGATKLGEDLTSPYNFTWTNVAAGSYTLTARATDNASATITSSGINVTVSAAAPCDAATASSHDGNVPANVLDNDFNTRWSASGDGQWIQFCLGSLRAISGVQIAFYKGNERQSIFDILVSSDLSSWTTVTTGLRSSGTSLALETFPFAERSAKYVRIVGRGNSLNLWNSYTEVKINSTAISPAEARIATLPEVSHAPIVTEDEQTDMIVAAYPNPAADAVTIIYQVKQSGRVTLTLFSHGNNASHKIMDEVKDAGTHEVVARLKELPAGLLLLKMVQGGKLRTLKIVKK